MLGAAGLSSNRCADGDSRHRPGWVLLFVQDWTNYFLPFVVLPSSGGYPIQIGLSLLGRPSVPLATVLTTLPIVALFIGFERFLISGKTAGALAGE